MPRADCVVETGHRSALSGESFDPAPGDDTVRRVLDAQERLFEKVLNGADVRALVQMLGVLIERPVAAMVPWSGAGSQGSQPELTPRVVSGSEHSGRYVSVPVVSRGEQFGRIVVPGVEQLDDPAEQLIVSYGARLIALVLQRQCGGAPTSQQARSFLLMDLLSGVPTDDKEILKRGATLDCTLSNSGTLLLVEIGGGDAIDEGLARRLSDLIAALAERATMVTVWEGRVVALVADEARVGVTGSRASTNEEDEPLAAAICLWLDEHHRDCAALVCVARVGDCRRDLASGYRESVEALRMAHRLGWSGRVVRSHDRALRSYQILGGEPDEGLAARFVEDVLGEIERYDAEHGGALLRTLTAYLGQNGNLAATTAALNVHINTLKYRLSRIVDLSGLRLRDAG